MSDDKAIVVLTQSEVDTAIHALEELSWGMDDERFRDDYGNVYEKLMAIETADGSEFQVK